MESSGPLIVDVSSDEETGFVSGRRRGRYDIRKDELTEDDCFWLTRLLDEVDGNKDDDSDDVVVVSEVFPKPCKKSRLESLKPSRKVGESTDDDDCVVLDCDPGNPVVVVNTGVEGNEDKGNDSGKDSDDIEIVGEKGEVACRDFPHARHLCVKFHFASTPHEFHCTQCHCYVCDCLAPCSHWGTGISTVDHCHANDKEEHWRNERKRMKNGGKPMPVNPMPILATASDTSLLEALLETPQVPDPPQTQYSTFLLNQGLSPVPISPCTPLPSSANQGRIHPTGHVPMHRPRPHLVSLQSRPTHDSVPSKDRSNNARTRSGQSFTPLVVLKRPGVIGSFTNNRNASEPRLHRNSHTRRYHPFQIPFTNGSHGSNPVIIASRAGSRPVLPPPLSSPPDLAVGAINYVQPSPEIHSGPYSSYPFRDPVQFQSHTSSQPYTTTGFGSAVQLQLKLPSESSVESLENLISPQSREAFQPNSPFPSQSLVSHPSDGVTAFGGQLHSRSMILSPSSVGNSFESQPSRPQAHFSPTSLLNGDHNYIQQGNHTHKGLDATSDFGINYVSSFSYGNQEIDVEVSHCQGTASDDSFHLQYLTNDNDHRLGVALEDSHSLGAVPADNSSQIYGTYGHFPESKKSDLNFNIDNWLFENDSFPGALDAPFSPGWNEFSMDPASVSIDTGTPFDI